ncbi:Insulin-induced protein 2 protein, partial [Lunasporangiospora selenospora]
MVSSSPRKDSLASHRLPPLSPSPSSSSSSSSRSSRSSSSFPPTSTSTSLKAWPRSPSILDQFWAYLPFSARQPIDSNDARLGTGRGSRSTVSANRPSCSTQTCLSYCCSPSSYLDHGLVDRSTIATAAAASPFHLRPKSHYYPKRQRPMPHYSTPSRIAHASSSFPTSPPCSDSSHSHSSGSGSDDALTEPRTIHQSSIASRRMISNPMAKTASAGGSGPIAATSSTLSSTYVSHTVSTSRSGSPQSLSTGSSSGCDSRNSITASSCSNSSSSYGNNSSGGARRSALSLASDGPYLFICDVAVSLYYPIRAMILFVLGFVFSLLIDHLQAQHQLMEYPGKGSLGGIHSHLWDTASWLPPTCGASAVLVGTIYPLGDYLWWGRQVKHSGRDWSSVMRCMGGFIGVNYAASKLTWTSSVQVFCTLALISAGLWFLFDRTFHGFVISFTVASMGTAVAYLLVLNGWYSFTKTDLFGVGSWIPCILYSSSVCFGSIGRQLDVVPEAWYHSQGTNNSRVHLKS